MRNRATASGGGKIDFAKARARAAQKKTEPIVWATSEPAEVSESFSSRLKSLISGIGKGVVEDYKTGGQDIIDSVTSAGRGEQSPVSAGLQTAGTVAKTAFSPITRLLEPAINYAADKISDIDLVQKVASTDFVGERLEDIKFGVESYNNWAKENPELSKNIEAGANIGLLLAGEKPAQSALKSAAEGTTGALNKGVAAKNFVVDTAKTLKNEAPTIVNKGREVFKPIKSAEGLAGEITQAKNARDIARSQKALTELDVTGVKTYDDLLTKVREEVKTTARQVDDELAKDTNLYKPKDLTVTATSDGGKPIKIDYVSRALNHLEEIYKTVGDDVKVANIQEAIAKYVKQGFTRQEVNDLARLYGQDAPKGFSKLGDALTSKSAQASEAIRSGLKDVARSGLDDTAQALDLKITNLKTLEGYTLKMQEAVQNLTNRVEERGILEQAGRAIGQVADIATGGFARSLFSKFLVPSNVGQKVLNSLDLEAKLARNLQLLQKAATETTDEGIIRTIKQIIKEQPRTEVKPIKAPQFEQRSSFERSPIIQYIRDNPPNIGLSIRDVKSIDNLTKKEMIDIIDYARLNKDYNQSLEDAIGYLAEKFNLKGKTLDEIADELEVLVRDTKTSTVKEASKKPASKKPETTKSKTSK